MVGSRQRPSPPAGDRSPEETNGFGLAHVVEIQRARILSAMFEVATERGAANVSVAHVVERSGVSRRTFYEQFSDREECFLATFEEALAYASERVLPAYGAAGSWRERIRAGLVALLCFLDEEPVIGRLLICESPGGGPKTLGRRGQLQARLMGAIDEGREDAKAVAEPAPLAAEGVLGGVLAVIAARLVEEDRAPLVELTGPLMSMIVLPYLGPAVARRELGRPVSAPAARKQGSALLSDPFKGAGMRLTYRTVRVLMAIAYLGGREPGPSNRTIGDTAGINDQGQISKLLTRLERIGLVTNSGLGPGQGAPNAWALTPSGRQIVNGIRAHTEGFE
jgi:AcrR family transcriptional regulator